MEIIFKLDEIEATAKNFISFVGNYKILTFNGELGAGKTTFINAVCKILGVEETVTSPTYALIQEYATKDNKIIYHMDLYRIKNYEEALNAGIEDCLLSGELCMVEWPDKAIALFPKETIPVFLQTLENNFRKLVVQLP
jgi:tRNA threonylcarbamoyladenosine biosynthesis protein TsaE